MARSITGQATCGKQKIVLNSGTLIPNNNFGGIPSVNAHRRIKPAEADTRHQSQTTASSQHHLQTMPCGSIRPYLHLTSRKSEGIPKSGQSRICGVSRSLSIKCALNQPLLSKHILRVMHRTGNISTKFCSYTLRAELTSRM